MDVAIETVNRWGNWFAPTAFQMVLQSSLLIVLLGTIDWLLRKRARAIVRYSLWMLLLIKLILPVDLSLPTSLIQVSASLEQSSPRHTEPGQVSVRMDTAAPLEAPIATDVPDDAPNGAAAVPAASSRVAAALPPQNAALTPFGWALLGSFSVSLVLFAAVIRRSFRLWRLVRSCPTAPQELQSLFASCRDQLGIRRRAELRISDENLTPALCGILRPRILLPRALAATLNLQELRAVLLHELAHFKRGDLPVNLAQTVLQIAYFFHPLLWPANSRIRKLREQAVDEVVLVAMGREAEVYPTALLNVARFSLNHRPFPFGAVGIMESRSAFSNRIRRMLARPFPTNARLGTACVAAIVLLGVCVLPMAGKDKVAGEQQGQRHREPGTGTEKAGDRPSSDTNSADREPAERRVAESSEQLFEAYEIFGEARKRSQAVIVADLISRTNVVEFLSQKLRKDFSKPSTVEQEQSRRKAVHLVGKLGPRGQALVLQLLECLEDEEEIRQAATQALGNIGPGASVAIPMLQEELHFQNLYAGAALARIAPASETVLNALIEAALDPSKEPMFRHQTVEAFHFMQVRNAAWTNALQKLCEEPDGDIKDSALRLLGKLEKPRYVVSAGSAKQYSRDDLPALLGRLRTNPDDFEAAYGIRQLGADGAEALPVLIELLEQRKGRFPANYAGMIGQMGAAASNAVPALIGCLAEDDRGLFMNSLIALGRIGPAAGAAKPKLTTLLDDRDPDARWNAANALRRLDPAETERCVPILLEPFKYGVAQAHHISAIKELGEHGREVIPELRRMLDSEEHVRFSAADALLALEPSSGSELVPMLIRALQDPETLNRPWAASLLGRVGPPASAALPILRELTDHENDLLATAAREAIDRIEQKSP